MPKQKTNTPNSILDVKQYIFVISMMDSSCQILVLWNYLIPVKFSNHDLTSKKDGPYFNVSFSRIKFIILIQFQYIVDWEFNLFESAELPPSVLASFSSFMMLLPCASESVWLSATALAQDKQIKTEKIAKIMISFDLIKILWLNFCSSLYKKMLVIKSASAIIKFILGY